MGWTSTKTLAEITYAGTTCHRFSGGVVPSTGYRRLRVFSWSDPQRVFVACSVVQNPRFHALCIHARARGQTGCWTPTNRARLSAATLEPPFKNSGREHQKERKTRIIIVRRVAMNEVFERGPLNEIYERGPSMKFTSVVSMKFTSVVSMKFTSVVSTRVDTILRAYSRLRFYERTLNWIYERTLNWKSATTNLTSVLLKFSAYIYLPFNDFNLCELISQQQYSWNFEQSYSHQSTYNSK